MSKEVGATIRKLRENAGLTLEEVGKSIGVSRATVHRYESGEISEIPSEKIQALARLFNVRPGYIMGWTVLSSGSGKIGDVVVDISDQPYITVREVALLAEFEKLNDENKDKLFAFISTLVELQEIETSLKAEKEALEWYKAHNSEKK